jgi:hypothetical protein
VYSRDDDTGDIGRLILADRVRIASAAFGIASAALAIWIVRSIVARQEITIGRARTPQMPPAPQPIPPPPTI